ncbi:MAG: hypothetical protein E5V95_33490 [Mesorhizobium sp.]|uniref:hypothetical protein n=1 Tax=Mesorhizobium sp. TaxID=1871066 RepID=UPI001208C336|nr:hypothetical protein [Mesorhizobium sp.]TIV13622.1 MAG: hypothetical protein E5V95_33490 [Mesorhizobium sp.]
MPTASFVDLPLGVGQRAAFVEASLELWIKGYPVEDQPVARDVSAELRGYVDAYFQNGCRWDGLYPVIAGDIERREYFLAGLFWLKLEFNFVGLSKAISSMQPDWGYRSRPEWSYREDSRTYDFFQKFIDDVEAQIHVERDRSKGARELPVTLH